MDLKKLIDLWIFGKNKEQEKCPNFTLAKLRLASHPTASEKTLRKLAFHPWEKIVVRVAENRNTALETLELLANHPSSEVRIAVAENPASTLALCLQLVEDSSVDLRFSMAENANMPAAILWLLSKDENAYVAERAKKTISRLRENTKKLRRQKLIRFQPESLKRKIAGQ